MAEVIALDTGSVEYSAEDASVDIDELITLLEEAKESGAERVTLASGNHRGGKYLRLRTDYEWT